MGGTLTRPVQTNPLLQRFGGDLLPATFGESIAAAFDDPTLSPLGLLTTQARIAREAGPRETGIFESPDDLMLNAPPDETRLTPFESPDALNEEFGHLGLSFKEPTRRGVARILADQKRAERIRADVLARGPGGVLAGGAQFGAMFVASALDPINIASAFVPVVGQARFAGMVARAGKTSARFSRGAIEGAVGNALIEPIVGGLATGQQLDYGMTDALVNIGLGGLLGGGLHVTGGKIGDLMSKAAAETREAALRTAVAQMAEGRQTEISDIMRADPSIRERLVTAEDIGAEVDRIVDVERRVRQVANPDTIRVATALVDDEDALRDSLRALRQGGGRPEGLVDFLVARGGLRESGGELAALGISGRSRPGLVNNRGGLTFDDAGEAAAEAGFFSERPTPAALLDALDQDFNRSRPVLRPDETDTGQLDEIDRLLSELGVSVGVENIEDVVGFLKRLAAEPPFGGDILPSVTRQAVIDDLRRGLSGDASPRAAAEGERPAVDADDVAAEAEADFQRELVEELRAGDLLDEAGEAQIRDAELLVEKSEQYGRGVRAAAACLIGN